MAVGDDAAGARAESGATALPSVPWFNPRANAAEQTNVKWTGSAVKRFGVRFAFRDVRREQRMAGDGVRLVTYRAALYHSTRGLNRAFLEMPE